jgi:WhiB family transcriptional regulator, redox-sensing transcriptional regulator
MTVRATWRDDAACRDADPDLFFPIGTTGPTLVQIGEAKRICRACPAQASCLAWALENGVADGIWGGTTHDERRAIRALPATQPSAANAAAAGRARRTGNPRARRANISSGRPKSAQPAAAIGEARSGETVAIIVGSSSHAAHRVVGSVAIGLARHSQVPLIIVP